MKTGCQDDKIYFTFYATKISINQTNMDAEIVCEDI